MKISKKCQYALKAIFELAWRNETGSARTGNATPAKTRDIAHAQHMSSRFTEVILNELRHAGFVESRRGNEGGYILTRKSDGLSLKEVIECIEGPISLAPGAIKDKENALLPGNSALKDFFGQVNKAVNDVCENVTFADLVDFENANRQKYVLNYNI